MAIKSSPPRLASCLFKRMFTADERSQILIPLHETYRDICQHDGDKAAARWYWKQLFKSTPIFIKNSITRRGAMTKNLLKITLRNLKKHLGYSLINIIGLAISMACFILIFLWISDELSYDCFHNNMDRIYRVGNYDIDDNDDIYYAVTSGPLAAVLKEKFPEVEKSVRVGNHNGWLEYKSKKFRENGILCVGPAFLDIFTFPLLQGDSKTALREINSILLSERLAKKYFEKKEALGQVLRLETKHDMLVTGIFKNIPGNSNLKFDFLIPFVKLKDLNQSYKRSLDNFDYNDFFTYILLKENVNYGSISQKIEMVPQSFNVNSKNRLALQPIADIHLRSDYTYDRLSADKGDIKYIYILSVIAAFILIIAFINYMSLTTARSGGRLKEVGLRKLVGAQKSNIIGQFIGETILLSLLSMILSFTLVATFLPIFNQVSGKDISLNILGNGSIIPQIFVVVVLAGILSGCYPALIISSFHPLNALKGTIMSPTTRSTFRKILVVVQFSMSVILIISSIFVHGQLKFMKNKKFSFEKNQIIHFNVDDDLIKKVVLMENEMKNIPGVLGFTVTNLHSEQLSQSYLKKWQGKTGDGMVSSFFFYVDHQTLKAFNLEIAQGRFFSREFPSDAREGVVINQAAVRAMDMESPVGKTLYRGRSPKKIIGVVKDFNFRSFRFKIDPMVFYFTSSRPRYFDVKVGPQNIATTMEHLERIWKKNAPGYPFEYRFIEDRYKSSYDSEVRMGTLFSGFTFLAFLISSLGLFGLASYLVQQKTKEIGIRKVLGADATKIVAMLSGEYLILVALANIIAWPVAYLFISNWLKNFAYKLPVGVLTFILSGFLTLVLALISVGYQSIKAALTDPAKTLKFE